MTSEKRLNKFISETGFCSRREADRLIEQNRVTINGRHPELGTKVQAGDSVEVDGKAITAAPEDKTDRVYIAYNKPIGITCTTERQVKGNIVEAVGHKQRIFPIGRLDKPSEGLILLTSDGDIVNKILRAENAHDKEYLVTVDKPLSERFVQRMSKGVPILGTVTKPCKVSIQSRFVFKIILTQGLNRQIRRMCEFLGYEVKKLVRSRIMHIDLTGIKPGQWRDLTEQELNQLNQAVAGSSKTTEVKHSETKRKGQSPSSRGSEKRGFENRSSDKGSSGKRRSDKGSERGARVGYEDRKTGKFGKSAGDASKRAEWREGPKPSSKANPNPKESAKAKKVYSNPASSAKPKNKPAKAKSGGNTLSLKGSKRG